jgi:hypothetical protein
MAVMQVVGLLISIRRQDIFFPFLILIEFLAPVMDHSHLISICDKNNGRKSTSTKVK